MSADRINQEGPEPLAWHVELPIGDGKTAVYVRANERDALELKHRYFDAVVTPLYSLAAQPAQPAPSQPVGASETVGQALRLARRALYELIACDQHQLEAKNHALAAIDAALSAPQPAAQPQAQPTPSLKRHALEAAKALSEYAAAPFFPDTDKRGKVRSTTAEWWDGLAELIEESQPLIYRGLRECTEPYSAAQPQAVEDAARVRRLQDAIEGECDGLAISADHARAILEWVDGDAARTAAAGGKAAGRA